MRRDDEPPAGAGGAERPAPAGLQGRAAWRKALAEHNAALIRRKTRRRATAPYRPGMTRKPPPPPGGDDAA